MSADVGAGLRTVELAQRSRNGTARYFGPAVPGRPRCESGISTASATHTHGRTHPELRPASKTNLERNTPRGSTPWQHLRSKGERGAWTKGGRIKIERHFGNTVDHNVARQSRRDLQAILMDLVVHDEALERDAMPRVVCGRVNSPCNLHPLAALIEASDFSGGVQGVT